MKNTFLKLSLTISLAALSPSLFATGKIVASCSLYPAGSFDATSTNIIGKGYKQGTKFFAKELKVPVFSLTTENGMRDKHMKEKLKEDKFPFIFVKDIKAEKGTGTAKITIMGTTKDLKFKYREIDSKNAEATFDLNLPDYKIEGISYKGVGVEDKVEVVATIPYEKK